MSGLSHIDKKGAARMVDVGGKPPSERIAVAAGHIAMQAATLKAVLAGDAPKGDVIGPARVAGIMAAKKTADLIPLCHPLALTGIDIEITPDTDKSRLVITGTVKTTGQTGVEMEALTAVSVAALTLYDMAKALDRTMTIGGIRLLRKSGGAHGDYAAPADPAP